MQAPSSGPPVQPVIRKLDERVVNKIAAGEVIQRPASALKEMLENAIDAGATQIAVTVKEGGNKLLQITDNGHGIRKEDLPLLCYRHTTSKLREYEDLETIGTLGFRGEALCSISFVSHMTVTTMSRGADYGYRVTYRDSEMEPPGPRPVASVPGTTITVEDLFYNVPTRRKALRSASEEYSLITDTVSRYAVYCNHVGMSCKRHGDARADVSSTAICAAAGQSRLDSIRQVYGASVARELLPLQLSVGDSVGPEVGVDQPMAFRLDAYVSGANYGSGKKTVLVLFINGRSVECAPLRRTVEGVYAALLPKAAKPWLFMDLRLPPRHVEVNMHPTKREVGFMNQDEIVEAIRRAVEAKLLSSNDSRTFATASLQQAQLPFALLPQAGGGAGHLRADGGVAGPDGGQAAAAPAPAPYRPDKLVRTDHRSGTLDTFVTSNAARAAAASGNIARKRAAPGAEPPRALPPSLVTAGLLGIQAQGISQLERGNDGGLAGDAAPSTSGRAAQQPRPARRGPPAVVTQLASVRELLQEAEGDTRLRAGGPGPGGGGGTSGGVPAVEALADLLREHTYVGMADTTLALVQHGTRLYLLDVARLSADMFYQLALRRWEQATPLRLEPPPQVSELALLGLEVLQAKGEWQPEDGSPEELSELVTELVQQKGAMLKEYLAIEVDEQGCLLSLPVLLEGHSPDLTRLPDFVMALARDVEWSDERECFKTLAQAIANLYAVAPPVLDDSSKGTQRQPSPAGAAVGLPTAASAAAPMEVDGEAAQRLQPPGQQQAEQQQQQYSEERGPEPDAPCPDSLQGTQGAQDARVAAHEYVVKNVAALEKLYRIFERC